MKITVLSGTNREGSYTLRVATQIAQRYAQIDGVEVSLLDLRDLPAAALLPSAYDSKPAELAPLIDAVVGCDGLHVVTPEYNGGFPGALKVFIDMLPFPVAFERRAVAFTGVANGRWGALRPVEQLQQIFAYRNAFQFAERVFLPAVKSSLTEDHSPADAFVNDLLHQQVRGFARFVEALEGQRAPL